MAVMGYFSDLMEEKRRARPTTCCRRPWSGALTGCRFRTRTCCRGVSSCSWPASTRSRPSWLRLLAPGDASGRSPAGGRGPGRRAGGGGGVPALVRLRGAARKVMQDGDSTDARCRRATWSSRPCAERLVIPRCSRTAATVRFDRPASSTSRSGRDRTGVSGRISPGGAAGGVGGMAPGDPHYRLTRGGSDRARRRPLRDRPARVQLDV